MLLSSGFVGIIHYSRWMLGSFSTYFFELVSGKFTENINFARIFWPWYVLVFCVLITIGCLSIAWKKFKSRNQVIQINLEANEEGLTYNNQTQNKPILNVYEVTFAVAFVMLICVFYVLPNISDHDGDFNPHYQILFTEIVSEVFTMVLLPLYIIIKKDSLKNFLWNEIQNYFDLSE